MEKLAFALTHYSSTVILVVMCYLLGRLTFVRAKYDSRLESLVVSVGLGLGIVAYLVLTVGLLGALYPRTIWILLAASFVAAYPVWRHFPCMVKYAVARIRCLSRGDVLVIALLSYAAFAFLFPLMRMPLYPPEPGDATSYHLAAAQDYVRTHSIHPTPYLRMPVFPQTCEMLYTLMLTVYDDIAAQLVHFLSMWLIAAVLYVWGRKRWSQAVGVWAAALWLASPQVQDLARTANIDILLTLFVVLATFALFEWSQTRQANWLIAAAAFSGFAAGTKYTGLVFLFLYGAYTLYVSVRERRASFVLQFAAIALAVAAPWYIRNYIEAGNPLWPLHVAYFADNYWNAADLAGQHAELWSHGQPRTLFYLMRLPFDLAFHQKVFHSYMPVLPLLFLAWPLSLLVFARDRYGRSLALIVTAFALTWFASVQVLRYLMPIIPLLALLAAGLFERLARWAGVMPKDVMGRRAFICFTTIVIALYSVHFARDVIIGPRGELPTTHEHRVAYLGTQSKGFAAIHYLNSLEGSDYSVYVLYESVLAYYADGVFKGDWFGPCRYSRILDHMSTGDDLYRQLESMKVGYFAVATYAKPFAPPTDASFARRFRLLYSSNDALVYELVRPK